MKKFHKTREASSIYRFDNSDKTSHSWFNVKYYDIDIIEEMPNYKNSQHKIILSFIFLFRQINKGYNL